jgi:hypothetical protein
MYRGFCLVNKPHIHSFLIRQMNCTARLVAKYDQGFTCKSERAITYFSTLDAKSATTTIITCGNDDLSAVGFSCCPWSTTMRFLDTFIFMQCWGKTFNHARIDCRWSFRFPRHKDSQVFLKTDQRQFDPHWALVFPPGPCRDL